MGGSLGGEVSKRGVPGRWGGGDPSRTSVSWRRNVAADATKPDATSLHQMQPNQMPHRCISCNQTRCHIVASVATHTITSQVRRHLARRIRSQTSATESPIPLWHPNHDKCRMMHSMQFRTLRGAWPDCGAECAD